MIKKVSDNIRKPLDKCAPLSYDNYTVSES